MKSKPLEGQLTLELFAKPLRTPTSAKPLRTPTWDDVQKGRAKLVDRIVPCEGEECMFFQGGQCVHTADRFGYPKKRPNGMCLAHFIVWND